MSNDSVQRYVLVPSSVLTDSERNALLHRSHQNAASSTVQRLERQIAAIASDPNLSSEVKTAQLKSAVSSLDSATRDYLHSVADVEKFDDATPDSITLPYYTPPPPDQLPVAPEGESLAGRETLLSASVPTAVDQSIPAPTLQEPVAESTTLETTGNRGERRYFTNFQNKLYRTRKGREIQRTNRLIDEI